MHITTRDPKLAIRVFALVGMALYWPLLRRTTLFYSLAGHDETASRAIAWYGCFLALTGIAVAASIAYERRRGRIRPHLTGMLAILFVCQAACKCFEALAGLSGIAGEILSLCDVGLYVGVLVSLTYMWAFLFISIEQRTAAILALASFAISIGVNRLWLAPAPVGTVALALIPLASILCWQGAARAICPDAAQAGAKSRADATTGGFSGRLLFVIILFLLSGALVRGVVHGAPSSDAPVYNPLQDLITLACAIALIAWCMASPTIERFLRVSWSMAAVLFFAGLLTVVALPDAGIAPGGSAVVVGRTCLGALFWLMLVNVAHNRHLPMTYVFGGAFLLVEVASSFLSYVLVPEVSGTLGLLSPHDFAPPFAILTFALIVATVVFFNQTEERTIETVDMPAEFLGGNQQNDCYAKQLAPYNLTEREVEVAGLLAAGNSQKKIADVLGVSIGTVQSHVRGIYRKVDVHSKQELIDMLKR